MEPGKTKYCFSEFTIRLTKCEEFGLVTVETDHIGFNTSWWFLSNF